VGQIVGGTGENSGIISGSFNTGTPFGAANIGRVEVMRGITGGIGNSSGKILAPSINSVTIGTAGAPADIVGGAGQESGSILGDHRLGKVVVNGDVIGGAGQDVLTSGAGNDVLIGGELSPALWTTAALESLAGQ